MFSLKTVFIFNTEAIEFLITFSLSLTKFLNKLVNKSLIVITETGVTVLVKFAFIKGFINKSLTTFSLTNLS